VSFSFYPKKFAVSSLRIALRNSFRCRGFESGTHAVADATPHSRPFNYVKAAFEHMTQQ
jgi:hypothetical protein